MVLANYVILQPGQPVRMHFDSHEVRTDTITDPRTRTPKPVNKLQFHVDELNGQRVSAYYSILSDKHAKDFEPFIAGQRYLAYDFVVSYSGDGFQREYSVHPEVHRK